MAKGKKTGGRVAGTPNKLSGKAKEALELTFEGIGGVPAFITWAKEERTEFYKLWGKLVPKDVEVSGGEGPIRIVVETGLPNRPPMGKSAGTGSQG